MIPVDFKSITDFDVRFTPNPSNPRMHQWLNQIYQDSLPGHARVFSDPVSQTEVLDTAPLLKTLQDIIIKEMILEHAHETDDEAHIALLIKNAVIHVACLNLPSRRISKSSFTSALEHARAKNTRSIELLIDTSLFYITTNEPITYHDWSKFTTDSTLAMAPPTTPASSVPVVTIPQSPPIDYSAIASAMATAFNQVRLLETPPSQPPTHNQGHSVGGTTQYHFTPTELFASNTLPADVRERYEGKLKGNLIKGSVTSTPYSDGNFYHLATSDSLILGDGTFFFIHPYDEKSVMRDPEYCRDDTFAGIRRWYVLFGNHLRALGIYIHPLWCYRKNHGGKWGFLVGDATGSDLPKRLELSLTPMSHLIHRLLQKHDMFPKDSKIRAIVDACPGDGYHALKSILLHAHPAFHPSPATLLTTYPSQGTNSLLQYYMHFHDYLQLRAYVNNYASTLDSPDELDIFLARAKYSEFLIRVTRSERRDPDMIDKYSGSQLLETLQAFLQAPDSPLHQDIKRQSTSKHLFRDNHVRHGNDDCFNSYPNKSRPGNDDRFQTYHNKNRRFPNPSILAPVSQLTADHHDASTVVVDNTTAHMDTELFDDVYTIDVPPEPEQRRIFQVYANCINQVHQQPHTIVQKPCLVCQGLHLFKDCPVLNNTPFLQQHLIRFKQFSNRLQQDMNSSPAQRSTPVNYYQCLTNDEPTSDSDNDSPFTPHDHATDFQQGRL